MSKSLKLNKCLIIAEISANHGQDFKRAVAMIKKAKECGADAVKLQAYTPQSLTINAENKYFRIKHPEWGGQTLYQLYEKSCAPLNWFKELKKIADDCNILFFATAFDKKDVDFLQRLHVPFHKISSFELVDLPLIEYTAKTRKPIILSTGMATFSEIKEAVDTARNAGANDVILFKCVSSYPARPREMNLATIAHMNKAFNCLVGLSDHTMGSETSVAAVSMGARLIEKHFTLSRKIKTSDSFFSIEPDELKSLVNSIRIVEEAIGAVHYGLTKDEKKSRIFRRSIFVVRDIKKGERFTDENIRSIRPANGLKPKYIKSILNKKANKKIACGTPMKREFVS